MICGSILVVFSYGNADSIVFKLLFSASIAMELFFARLRDNHAIKGEEMWWCGWFWV